MSEKDVVESIYVSSILLIAPLSRGVPRNSDLQDSEGSGPREDI
jgi:hypothetical protein